ncbi:MAG: CPBP family intramembrane metalloprotease [Lachnospiraceae bacterium]|nr:CPBP family intramembrane metalloprotease [Lachnospiraceae bacterium]
MNTSNKTVNQTNILYLSMIITYLAATLLVALLTAAGTGIGAFASILLGEVVILIPVLIFLILTKADLKSMIPLRRPRVSTILLSILFAFLIMPAAQWLNIISQLFSENVAIDAVMSIMDELPFLPTFMAVAVIGPLCEELTFRGVIFSGLKRSGRIFASIILSAVFFGLMHMNLNQLFYAFYLGICFALLTEATGSILPSFLCHFLINGYNTAMPYIASKLLDGLFEGGSDIFDEVAREGISNSQILIASFTYLIPAVIGLFLAALVFFKICNIEGSSEHIYHILKLKRRETERIMDKKDEPERTEAGNTAETPEIWYSPESRQKVLTIPGYVAIGFCLLIIFFLKAVLDLIR